MSSGASTKSLSSVSIWAEIGIMLCWTALVGTYCANNFHLGNPRIRRRICPIRDYSYIIPYQNLRHGLDTVMETSVDKWVI